MKAGPTPGPWRAEHNRTWGPSVRGGTQRNPATTVETLICPRCGGARVVVAIRRRRQVQVSCETCHGDGWISVDHMARIERGQRMREERRAAGVSLAQRALELGVSVDVLARREDGRA